MESGLQFSKHFITGYNSFDFDHASSPNHKATIFAFSVVGLVWNQRKFIAFLGV